MLCETHTDQRPSPCLAQFILRPHPQLIDQGISHHKMYYIKSTLSNDCSTVDVCSPLSSGSGKLHSIAQRVQICENDKWFVDMLDECVCVMKR